ncbi:MAG: hypothetical protein ABSD49_04060 [Candidatus Bathyarchaeia archaeon]
MGTIVYMFRVKVPSRAAKGYGWVWKHVAKLQGRLPETREGLFKIFISKDLVKANLPAYVSIIRNNAVREKRGFKSVMYGKIDERNLEIIRPARAWHDAVSLSYHKPIPTIGDLPMLQSRQPEWSKPSQPEFQRHGHIRFGRFANRLKEANASR